MIWTEQNKERFINTLKSTGGSSGNQRLRETRGWQEVIQDRIQRYLIDKGYIVCERGRGGSIAIRSKAQNHDASSLKGGQ